MAAHSVAEAELARMTKPQLKKLLQARGVPLPPRDHIKAYYLQLAVDVIAHGGTLVPPSAAANSRARSRSRVAEEPPAAAASLRKRTLANVAASGAIEGSPAKRSAGSAVERMTERKPTVPEVWGSGPSRAQWQQVSRPPAGAPAAHAVGSTLGVIAKSELDDEPTAGAASAGGRRGIKRSRNEEGLAGEQEQSLLSNVQFGLRPEKAARLAASAQFSNPTSFLTTASVVSDIRAEPRLESGTIRPRLFESALDHSVTGAPSPGWPPSPHLCTTAPLMGSGATRQATTMNFQGLPSNSLSDPWRSPLSRTSRLAPSNAGDGQLSSQQQPHAVDDRRVKPPLPSSRLTPLTGDPISSPGDAALNWMSTTAVQRSPLKASQSPSRGPHPAQTRSKEVSVAKFKFWPSFWGALSLFALRRTRAPGVTGPMLQRKKSDSRAPDLQVFHVRPTAAQPPGPSRPSSFAGPSKATSLAAQSSRGKSHDIRAIRRKIIKRVTDLFQNSLQLVRRFLMPAVVLCLLAAALAGGWRAQAVARTRLAMPYCSSSPSEASASHLLTSIQETDFNLDSQGLVSVRGSSAVQLQGVGPEALQACRSCPEHAVCSSGRMRCLPGYQLSGGGCIQDQALERQVAALAAVIQDYVCKMRGWQLCGDREGAEWVNESDIREELKKQGWTSARTLPAMWPAQTWDWGWLTGLDPWLEPPGTDGETVVGADRSEGMSADMRYAVVVERALCRVAEGLGRRDTLQGLREFRCSDDMARNIRYMGVACQVKIWALAWWPWLLCGLWLGLLLGVRWRASWRRWNRLQAATQLYLKVSFIQPVCLNTTLLQTMLDDYAFEDTLHLRTATGS